MVKVIVILENNDMEAREDVKKLLDFFCATDNYSCKIAIKKDFEAVCDTNGVSSQHIDFGIYVFWPGGCADPEPWLPDGK